MKSHDRASQADNVLPKGLRTAVIEDKGNRSSRGRYFTPKITLSINQVSELLQSQSVSIDEPINRLIALAPVHSVEWSKAHSKVLCTPNPIFF